MKQKRSKVDSHLNANYTFDNFIEGTCNKVAKSAGEAIAHNPGTTFNPLFIYGGAGVGKTHLENAIGKKIEEEHPEKNIVYVDALMFQTQYQDAVKNNNQTDFLNFYQMLDVLIIDDIQEFMGKTGTQNTFFHIFNALHLAGKQLIFASDRAPKLLQGLDQRLLSRFKWGLSIEIEEPDFETRKAILRSKIEANELQIPDDVVEYVAETVRGNVRDLEGIVNALLAYATLGDASINLELAKNVVGQSINIEEKSINIKDIQKAVCDYYSLEVNDIQTNSRKHEVVQARQVAMFLARKHTKKSLQYIGAQIGNRDHATVLHACKTVENLLDIDKGMQKSINYIESHLI
jgi:chromosomal replication initiator protein